MNVFGTLESNIAEATRRGLTGREALANLDKRATRLGERLKELIQATANTSYTETQIDRLANEAKELRNLRGALLDKIMAGEF